MLEASLSFLLWAFAGVAETVPVSLNGSAESMERQHQIAVESGYQFLRRPSDIEEAVGSGALVELEQTSSLGLKYPGSSVARPEVRHFLERFADDMRSSCGEGLVVTSLTRPLSRQPRNAHRLSVHPAGMAVDLRVPRRSTCRKWLEARMLELEERGILDITRERSPAHYHVALFPDRYLAYVGLDPFRRPEVVASRGAPRAVADAVIPYASPR